MKKMTKKEIVEAYNKLVEKYQPEGFKPAKANTWNNLDLAYKRLQDIKMAVAEIEKQADAESVEVEQKPELNKKTRGWKSDKIRQIFSVPVPVKITLDALAIEIKSDRRNTQTLVNILMNANRSKNPIQGVEYDRKTKTYTKK